MRREKSSSCAQTFHSSEPGWRCSRILKGADVALAEKYIFLPQNCLKWDIYHIQCKKVKGCRQHLPFCRLAILIIIPRNVIESIFRFSIPLRLRDNYPLSPQIRLLAWQALPHKRVVPHGQPDGSIQWWDGLAPSSLTLQKPVTMFRTFFSE